MAIKIESASGKGITGGTGGIPATMQKVEIVADTEAEILALPAYREVVTDADGIKVIPAKNSLAYTADLSVGYMLSPSGVWTKFRG